jgi:hypothetical protein
MTTRQRGEPEPVFLMRDLSEITKVSAVLGLAEIEQWAEAAYERVRRAHSVGRFRSDAALDADLAKARDALAERGWFPVANGYSP